MLAPIDKLKSGVNDIIQIVITTSCTLNCSNCTQLLPFRKDYRHMTLDCFRLAVQSLKEWPGVIGLFGGNPCSHPQFDKICEIFMEEIPEQRRRGLWSNDLLKHGYICRKTFYPDGRFNLNAHGDWKAAKEMDLFLPDRRIAGSDRKGSTHAPILVKPEDIGIRDNTYLHQIENCDINQKWSGAIVERQGQPYAYFCEVAAALDGVMGINRGVPAEPGWWMKTMPHFQDQVQACHNCAVPLRLEGRKDSDETYDVSTFWRMFTTAKRPTSIRDVDTQSEGMKGHEATDYMRVR